MSWIRDAACAGTPLELWFDESNTSEALQLCAICPVREQCLLDAVENDDGGIRGGMTELRRQRFATRAGRAGRKVAA